MKFDFSKTAVKILFIFFLFSFFGILINTTKADTGEIKSLTLTVGEGSVNYKGSVVGVPPFMLRVWLGQKGATTYKAMDIPTNQGNFSAIQSFPPGSSQNGYEYFFSNSASPGPNTDFIGPKPFGYFSAIPAGSNPVQIPVIGGITTDPPLVHTKAAVDVNDVEAVLVGDQTSGGPVTAWFQYGENSWDLDEQTSKIQVAKDGDFKIKITRYNNANITKGTTFYYKAFASNTGGQGEASNTESVTPGGNPIKLNPNNNQTGYVDKWYYTKVDGTRREPPFNTKEECKVEQEKPETEAQSDCYTTYKLLAPLPLGGTMVTEIDPVGTSFVGYLNMFFKLLIGIATVLSVVMIVFGGIQYMTSDLPFAKGEAKNKITGAVFGLILALASWVILYTLNPNILSGVFNIGLQSGTVSTISGGNSGGICGGAGTGECDPAKFTSAGFFAGKEVEAGKICMTESGGDNMKKSDSDVCMDGKPFSIGLFQINLIAHGNKISPNTTTYGTNCSNLFTKNDGTPITGNDYLQKPDGVHYDCKIKLDTTSQNQYNTCVGNMQSAATNRKKANEIFKPSYSSVGSFQPWQNSANKCSIPI